MSTFTIKLNTVILKTLTTALLLLLVTLAISRENALDFLIITLAVIIISYLKPKYVIPFIIPILAILYVRGYDLASLALIVTISYLNGYVPGWFMMVLLPLNISLIISKALSYGGLISYVLMVYITLSLTYFTYRMSVGSDVAVLKSLLKLLLKASIISFLIMVLAWFVSYMPIAIVFGAIAIAVLLGLDRIGL